MPFYYLSFCDITLPDGQQFLGATVVEADDEKGAVERTVELGINPGGEIAMKELDGLETIDQLPPEGRKYFNTFVARDDVMAEPHQTLGESDVEPTASVCQDHNPVSRV